MSIKSNPENQTKFINSLVLTRAMEAVFDGITILECNDEAGNIIYANKAFLTLTGYQEGEVLGCGLSFLFGSNSDETIITSIRTAIKSEKTYAEEVLCYRKDGMPFWNYITLSPVLDEHGTLMHCIAIHKDVTIRKEMESKMLKTIIETQEVERKRIAGDLHDGLGQTLTAVGLHFGALEQDIEALDDERVNKIFTKTRELIAKATAETRLISRNLMPNTLKHFGLKTTVEELVSSINALEEQLHIVFTCDLTERLDEKLEMVLYRILQELINNTIKHANANNMHLELQHKSMELVIRAHDDGVGFDANAELNDKGLGMGNLQHRIRSIQGSLQIDSEEGKGTSVLIRLPLR